MTGLLDGDRVTGVVKRFDDERGWGFIRPDDGTPDCFVHFRALADQGPNRRKTLTEGQRVEFEVEPGEKGPRALNVTVIP